MVFNTLCAPALIYIVFSISHITRDSLIGKYNIAMVKLVIPSSDFHAFQCTNNHTIGIHIQSWNKVMGLCKNDDQITFIISNEDQIMVEFADTS